MRKLLNTLYVTTPEAYLTKDGENIVVRVKEKDVFRIPVLNIEGIVTFGYMGASPALMKMCADRNVGLCFLSATGQFQGRVSGPITGNVLLRRTQYRIADDKIRALQFSRLFIAGKIANSRAITDRFKRDHVTSEDQLSLFLSVSEKLKRCKRQVLELVLSLINRKQISGKGFVEHGDNGIVMNDDVRKIVIQAWQQRKKETIVHPYLNESIPIGLIPYIQAMLLARFLRKDLDDYPVFLVK